MTTVDLSHLRRMQDLSLIEQMAYSVEVTSDLDEPSSPRDVSSLNKLARSATRPQFAKNQLINMPMLKEIERFGRQYQLVNENDKGASAYSDYWRSWESFCTHWVVIAEANDTMDIATSLVFDALADRQDLSGDEMLAVADTLWRDRWILEGFAAGQLIGALEQLNNVPQDAQRLSRLVDETVSALRVAKDTSESLDAWFEELRILSPRIHYGYLLSHALGDNRTNRLFDEMAADLGAVLGMNVACHVQQDSFSDSHLRPNPATGELPKLSELRYKFNARIFYPKFWFELAIQWLQNRDEERPARLDSYDPVAALGCAISHSFSSALETFSIVLPAR